MANIDNLNFKVILDDKEFNSKLKTLEKDAKKFNSTMSNLLNVKKAGVQISQKEVENNRRALQAKVDEMKAQEKINREKMKTDALQKKLNKQTEEGAKQAKRFSGSFQSAAGAFMQMFAFTGIATLVRDLIRVTGEFELQKATLGAMLDDMAAAEHLIGKIRDLSIKSPFTAGQLTGYAKQLSAFGVPADELYETTKMIGDMSAGLGVAADRLILAFGQVKSAAFLRGQEVRQFTEAGLPILQELAKEFEKIEGGAVSVGEVFDRISTRQVSFEMVRDILRDMTSEGGKFYNMQEVQANTLWGKLQQLKSQWELALNEIGTKNGTVIHNTIDGLINLVKNLETVGKWLRVAIITWGSYKAAMLAAWVIQRAISFGALIKGLISAMKATQTFTAAMKAANVSLAGILGFVGVVGGALYALCSSADDATESVHNLDEEIKKMHSKAVVTATAFERDIEALKELTQGTQRYKDAINQINDLYGDYLSKLFTERDSYEDIAEAAKLAKDAILEKSRSDTLQKYLDKINREYEKADEIAGTLIEGLWEIVPTKSDVKPLLKQFENQIAASLSKGDENIAAAFERAVKTYYGEDYEEKYKTLATLVKVFNVGETGKNSIYGYQLVGALYEYAHAIFAKQADIKNAYEKIDALYGKDTEWETFDEYQELNNVYIEDAKKRQELRDKENLSEWERAKESVRLEQWKYEEIAKVYEKYGRNAKAADYRKQAQEMRDFWQSWRGQVQSLLQKQGMTENRSYGLWPTIYTSSTDYVEQLVKDYKEISEQVEQLHFDPKTQEKVKQQKELIEEIAKLLNIDLTTGKKKGGGKTPLEQKLDELSALKKGYDKLKSLKLSDSTIIEMLKERFPATVQKYGDKFIEDLNFAARIFEAAEQLKKTQPDKANSILQALGLDDVTKTENDIEKAINAAKKYFEAIRKLKTSDFSIEGTGTAFDIGKIANQLSNKFNDIALNSTKLKENLAQIDTKDKNAMEAVKNTFTETFGEGSWDAFYQEYIEKGAEAIDKFAQMERDYERKLAQEKLNDMAKKIVGEALENIDMSHWGDKTINQIEAIRQRLAELMQKDLDLPKETLDKLAILGLTIEDLQGKIRDILGEKYSDATIEKFKALAKVAKDVASVAKTLGSELEKLGETLNNEGLSGLGRTLVMFESLAQTLIECDSLMQAIGEKSSETLDSTAESADGLGEAADDLKNIANSSDLVTMAIKLATTLITKIVSGINESQKALQDAAMAAIEYADALKQIEYNNLMESYETILGTDDYKKAIETMKKAEEYQRSMIDATKEVKVEAQDLYGGKQMSLWAMFSKDAREAAKQIGSLGVGDILSDSRTAWQRFWGTGNDLVKVFNINDFIDEDGMLMGEELKAVIENFGDGISAKNKEALTKILKDYELYTQAVEDTSKYLEELFGDVADNMADAFIEAFKASGEAALDYADIMDEVATNVAKSVVKSMILEEVIDEDKMTEMAKMLLSDPAGAMAMLDETMQAAANLAPYIQDFLQQMQPYFKMEGEASSLGDGIKGITEDTANLLASYLNAIRADVSYAKTIWERMDMTTQQIASLLVGFSAPSLMEYQAQIAANTYDTAQNTLTIMNDLKSVITSEGGATAIRTIS